MSWSAFQSAAPDLAAEVRKRLDAHTHMTLATIRRTGAPRISGTELDFRDDGEVYLGSMKAALKARDLQRDPRYAVHSGSDDPPAFEGDAKIAGVAEEVLDHGKDHHEFRLSVTEASYVRVVGKELVITLWTPAGTRELRR